MLCEGILIGQYYVACNVASYIVLLANKMIKSFKHKGLEKYFLTGKQSGINAMHLAKITRILDRLDASISSQDMDLPGYNLHPLKGKQKNKWSVRVSGNWRITFRFEGIDAVDVDYRDYH